jgi:hypothetical protein
MNEQLELWIKWEGGACPVNEYTVVEVELRNGNRMKHGAWLLRWSHDATVGDIVAYREVV